MRRLNQVEVDLKRTMDYVDEHRKTCNDILVSRGVWKKEWHEKVSYCCQALLHYLLC